MIYLWDMLHPFDNPFQQPWMHDFLNGVPGYASHAWKLKAGDVAGKMQAMVIREGGGPKGFLTARAIVQGGPLIARIKVDDRSAIPETGHSMGPVDGLAGGVFEGLVTGLVGDLKRRVNYIQLRNYFGFSAVQHEFLLGKGFGFEPEVNFVVRLEADKDPLAGFHGSRRRQVRKGLASGAEVFMAEKATEVSDFYAILKGIYRTRAQKPLASVDLFLHFLEGPCREGRGAFLLVRYRGVVIGGIMLLLDDKPGIELQGAGGSGFDFGGGGPGLPEQAMRKAYEWYVGGLDQEFPQCHPSVLATWAGIDFAWRNGFQAFDFLGAGNPAVPYGVRAFKSKFGGMQTNYGRYLLIARPTIYKLGKLGVKVYSRLVS
jgi:serine/alanine adding enzyme